MAFVAFPWVASLMTREPFLIGLVGTSVQLAWIGTPLVIGAIIDRSDRLSLIRASLMFQFVAAGLLGIVIMICLDLGDRGLDPNAAYAGIGVLIAAIFALGVAEVARDLGMEALLPQITPKASLERANSRLMTAELVASRFVGQPLGGLALTISAALPILLDALSFLASAALLARLKPGRTAGTRTERKPKLTVGEAMEGLRWLLRARMLRSMTFALAWSNLMSGIAVSTLVLFAQDVLRLGPTEYGVMLTGAAAGGLLGGAAAPSLLRRYGPGPVTIGSIAAKGTGYGLLALGGSAIGGAIALAILGAATMPWSVASRSLRQRMTPDALLGRVSAAHRTLNYGAIPVGMFLGGVVASTAGGLASPPALALPMMVAAIGMALLLPVAVLEFARPARWYASGNHRREAEDP